MKKISIIVPIFYEAESISLLYQELVKVEEQLYEREMEMELIFVDDGSKDCSLQALLKIREQRPSTKVIKLSRNFGAIYASKAGMRFVTGDCFMLLAADLQDPPALIVKMAELWLAGHKFVICVRNGRNDPFLVKQFAYIYNKLVRLFVVKDFPKGGFDMALMDRSMLDYLKNSSKNIYHSLLAFWLGYRPEIIFYERPKRLHGKSGWTFSKRIKLFIDSLLGFSVVPIRLISLFGICVSSLSLLYGMIIVIGAIYGTIVVQGFAAIVTLISFLLGIVIFMLGVIGEYIVRIFDELNKRPEAVIDEIYE